MKEDWKEYPKHKPPEGVYLRVELYKPETETHYEHVVARLCCVFSEGMFMTASDRIILEEDPRHRTRFALWK